MSKESEKQSLKVFEYSDYKDFLKAKIRSHRGTRGYKSQLSEAMGTPSSFLSQVLHAHIHLSLDHAYALAQFWGMTEDEREYFFALVQLERAGSKAFKAHLKEKLESIQKRNRDLATRFQQPQISTNEEQWIYYTTWMHGAVHMLITIPEFQTEDRIAARLQIPLPAAQSTLLTLQQMGLAQNQGGRWSATSKSLHLNKQSPASPVNHGVWRQRAVERMYPADDKNLHYCALHTLSRADIEKIRAILLAAIEESRAVVAPSKEEELICVNLDLFRV